MTGSDQPDSAPQEQKRGRPRKAPSEKAQNFSIRMPADMRAQLEGFAAASRRTLAAEILHRLQASLWAPQAMKQEAEMAEAALRQAQAMVGSGDTSQLDEAMFQLRDLRRWVALINAQQKLIMELNARALHSSESSGD